MKNARKVIFHTKKGGNWIKWKCKEHKPNMLYELDKEHAVFISKIGGTFNALIV